MTFVSDRRIRQALYTRARAAILGPPSTKPARSPDLHVRAARLQLEELAESNGPIVVGPWLGEVGYELLYWIPFVRWAARAHAGLSERFVVVSRGGVASWYGDLAVRYVDVFDIATPDELHLRQAESALERTIGFKQYDVSELDRELEQRARSVSGVGEGPLLHPSVLYELLVPLARLGATPRFSGKLAVFESISPPQTEPLRLPDCFIAVRFYWSHFFRDTPGTRSAMREILSSLSKRYALVHLDTGLRLDDHAGLDEWEGLRLESLSIPPAKNLEAQTAVIARARAFVGTYGGLAYLPPLLGVPSICFFTEPPGKYSRHLSLAHEVFADPRWGAFVPLDLRRDGGLGVLASVLAPFAETE